MSPRANPRRHDAGFSLIELLISILILGIITTMLIMGWTNLQRASVYAVATNHARGSLRDAMSRISSELRAAQPASLPSASPATTPDSQPVLMRATPTEVRLYSAFNKANANLDGSGVGALRSTRIWLDTASTQPPEWNQQNKTLYLQRDLNNNGSFTDPGDQSMILARNVANAQVADTLNSSTYTAVFRYAYPGSDGKIVWTDNANSSLDLASVVAVSVRLIVNRKMAGAPSYVDLTTTIHLRNASKP